MSTKELTSDKSPKSATIIPNGIIKCISPNITENFKNTTEIDFSNRNIAQLDDNIVLPSCLRSLNVSHNKFVEVPKLVMELKDLKVLDVSYNRIEYFNDVPSFCHAIEYLNLSENALKCPPLWIWSESPKNLIKLDINSNVHITAALALLQGNFDEAFPPNSLVKHVILYNCRLGKHLEFLGTFPKAQELEVGTGDWSCYAANHLQEIPCEGLNRCLDIESLNITNTHIYTITANINIFKCLREINLSHNNLNGIPEEFCELENLEICILSFNNILYLPDSIVKLKKLTKLCLDVNELCMLPQNILDLENLKMLDIYDNNIYEYPEGVKHLPEVDLAQNYFEEPEDQDYLDKREKLRLGKEKRQSGRKYEVIQPESERSSYSSDDDLSMHSSKNDQNKDQLPASQPSSPEDWDSDSHWVPHRTNYVPPSHDAYWLSYVKKKMQEGNLCPMDNHVVSIVEKVKYDKKCFPVEEYESDGQFDDFSEDDS